MKRIQSKKHKLGTYEIDKREEIKKDCDKKEEIKKDCDN